MAFAVNILALLLVIMLSWAAMMWLSGRFHGRGGATTVEIDGVGDLSETVNSDEPCAACSGVGARAARGRVIPCQACFGTGVLR